MKKQLLAALGIVFLSAGQLMAQDKDPITTLPTVTVTSEKLVNAEVQKAFQKTFPGAQNLVWYKENQNFIIKFIENDVKHRAMFTKKGVMKYDISYGTEKLLSNVMRDKVLSTYNDYNISRVANVKEAGRNIFVINLDGLKNAKIIRIEEEDMEEVQTYVKS
jgi:hypothetical protein